MEGLVKLLFGFFLSIHLSPTAQAGGIGGGGADGVGCNGGLFTLYSGDMKVVPSDLLKENQNIFPRSFFTTLKQETILESILKFLDKSNPIQAVEVRGALNRIKFLAVDKIESVETGIKVHPLNRIFFGCSRQQLAVQDFNSPSEGLSTVRVHKKRFSDLYVFDQALIKLHEAYLLVAHPKHNDLMSMETEARGNISKLFNSPGFNAFVIPDVLTQSGFDREQIKFNLQQLYLFFTANEEVRYSAEKSARMYDELIAAGLEVDSALSCRMPLLHYTLISGRGYSAGSEMVLSSPTASLALIKANSDVNARDWYGRTPLHLAVMRGDETVEALVEAGANINATWCKQGEREGTWAKTPLDIVSRKTIFGFGQVYAIYNVLRTLGAKTGQELGIKCPGNPKFSKTQKKAERCDEIERSLLDWER